MAIRRLSPVRQALAAALTLALGPGPGSAAPVAAQEGRGTIRGVLYAPDAETELAEGRVTAINVRTGKQYSSQITNRNGAYEIVGLPAGSYDIVIEAGGRIYVADHLVDLEEGRSVTVDFTVQPQKPASKTIPGLAKPGGGATTMGGPAGPSRGFWTSPSGIFLLSILGVGAALAIASDDGNASPSTP